MAERWGDSKFDPSLLAAPCWRPRRHYPSPTLIVEVRMSPKAKFLAAIVTLAASVGLASSPAVASRPATQFCTATCTAPPGCSVVSGSCKDNPDGTVTVTCTYKCKS